MPDSNKEWDLTIVAGASLAFVLPLTLLIPNFSVWTVVPKVQVTRFHVFAHYLTWSQLNVVIIALLFVFFCIYLEIRKRKLDEIVERVMLVSQVTDRTLDAETEKQASAMRACVDLLDASSDQYENLALLRDELRRRDCAKQQPPAIEESEQNM